MFRLIPPLGLWTAGPLSLIWFNWDEIYIIYDTRCFVWDVITRACSDLSSSQSYTGNRNTSSMKMEFWWIFIVLLQNIIWHEIYDNLPLNPDIISHHCCMYWKMEPISSQIFSENGCDSNCKGPIYSHTWLFIVTSQSSRRHLPICLGDIDLVSAGFCWYASANWFSGHCPNLCCVLIPIVQRTFHSCTWM